MITQSQAIRAGKMIFSNSGEYELAWRDSSSGEWKRKSFKTDEQRTKFMEKLPDDVKEFETSDP